MRPRPFRLMLLGYLAVVLQTTLVPRMALGPAVPDVLLVVVVYVGLTAPPYPALLTGWGVGLAKDVTSGGPLGAWAALFLGVAGLVVVLRGRFFLGRTVARALLVGLVAVGVGLLYLAVCALSGAGDAAAVEGSAPVPVCWIGCLGKASADAAYSALLAVPLFKFLYRLRAPLGLLDQPRIA